MRWVAIAIAACVLSAQSTHAKDVRISEGAASVQFMVNARQYIIERNQDLQAVIKGDYARVARPCPSQCIVPHSADERVENISELEIIEFLRKNVANDQGLLIDARVPTDYARAHIPAALNVPELALAPDNPYRDDIFIALGGQKVGADWTFGPQSKKLVFYAGGPWDSTAVAGIKDLLDIGYPADKLAFYRGGMQAWMMLGLSTQSNSSQ